MDFSYMFSDAFKYPLSDNKKLLMLSIPNLILQFISIIVTSGYIFSFDRFSRYSNSIPTQNELMSLGLVFIVMLLVTLIIGLFNRGIMIETIKKSFTSNELPDFDIKRFFVSGLKYIIVLIGYGIIPTFILLLLAFLGFGFQSAFADSSIAVIGTIIAMFIIIFVVVALIVIGIMMLVATGRLAETNSLSEAYDFQAIYTMAKQIGMLNIFSVQLLALIIFFILALVISLISAIPIIGPLIYAVVSSYLSLASARLLSLVYQYRAPLQPVNYINQSGVPNYQSRYADDSINQNKPGYNQALGGYDMPSQDNHQPQSGYNQPNDDYNRQDIADNTQEFSQNN